MFGPSEQKKPMLCAHSALNFCGPLAGEAPPAAVAAAQAGEAKAPGGDGHSLRAEDAANGSRGGGSHGGVLREGAEDGAGQGHHHGRGLDEDVGVLALLDTGLIAAVGQRGRATGSAWQARQALVVAGHVSGQDVHLVGVRPQRNIVGERGAVCQPTTGEQQQMLLGELAAVKGGPQPSPSPEHQCPRTEYPSPGSSSLSP